MAPWNNTGILLGYLKINYSDINSNKQRKPFFEIIIDMKYMNVKVLNISVSLTVLKKIIMTSLTLRVKERMVYLH